MRTSDALLDRHVKLPAAERRCSAVRIAITILWLAIGAALPARILADESIIGPEAERASPHLERQLDRLDRQGEVDPLRRRQLRDELRQVPSGPDRRRGERTLERQPGDRATEGSRDGGVAPRLPSSSLPSSLPPGIGSR